MSKSCKTKENILHSEHPDLEPKCYLIYLFMNQEERAQESIRRCKHRDRHREIYLKEE